MDKMLTKSQRRYLLLKRILDIMVSTGALMAAAIPMLAISLTLKILYPRTPVIFRQNRVGRNGELFTLIKFSSMKRGVPPYTAARDLSDREDCITGFGHFLRSTSLDELPQLFQVLSGKMSLIGPRPLIPQEEVMHRMRWNYGVYQLRPGITGWAQVNGRDTLANERKAAYDREYLEKMSFSMDWKIFRMTIRQLILSIKSLS